MGIKSESQTTTQMEHGDPYNNNNSILRLLGVIPEST